MTLDMSNSAFEGDRPADEEYVLPLDEMSRQDLYEIACEIGGWSPMMDDFSRQDLVEALRDLGYEG